MNPEITKILKESLNLLSEQLSSVDRRKIERRLSEGMNNDANLYADTFQDLDMALAFIKETFEQSEERIKRLKVLYEQEGLFIDVSHLQLSLEEFNKLTEDKKQELMNHPIGQVSGHHALMYYTGKEI